MTETKTTPAIYGAIAKVMKDLESIPKNGKMKFGNTSYDYLRADDVQERLNPSLVKNGIVVKSDYTTNRFTQGRGEGVPYVEVALTLSYISTKDGSAVQVSAVGEAQASDDKSVNKALTQALKNCHRATFQFASGEPEPDGQGASGTTEKVAPAAVRKATEAKKTTTRNNGPAYDELLALADDEKSPVTKDHIKEVTLKVAADNKGIKAADKYAKVLEIIKSEVE